jgi:DivIVA domain-containing protein
VISIFTRPTDHPRFRLRWLGYDRAEVDEFLRQTETERHQLKEDLAQLETVMASHGDQRRREAEQLSVLRIEVASCLEASIGALRGATERLSATPQRNAPAPHPIAEAAVLSFPARPRRRMLVAAGSAAALIFAVLAYQYHPRANERAAPTVPAAVHETSKPAPSGSPAPVNQKVDGLVLALTARSTCWVGTSIDGGQRLERVLKADETIMLRAEREAVLRVGNAAALSMLINNRVAKPLGVAGQVVTTRVTRANYLSYLANE